jgi:hypothetical protein
MAHPWICEHKRHTIAHDLESSYKTRKIKKSASWEATHVLCDF